MQKARYHKVSRGMYQVTTKAKARAKKKKKKKKPLHPTPAKK
jgi:hypothetical protein